MIILIIILSLIILALLVVIYCLKSAFDFERQNAEYFHKEYHRKLKEIQNMIDAGAINFSKKWKIED